MTDSGVVTIDGPAGVGKTTVGGRVAAALGLPFLDTGLFYRALAVAASRAGVGEDDPEGLERLARSLRLEINPEPRPEPRAWSARVDGLELHQEPWDPALARLLATVARHPGVRRELLPAQREPARHGAVAVGRDTGTVVFPEARCKVYLDAPQEVRLARRRQELLARGGDASEATLRTDVLTRDRTDLHRSEAPLRVPEGALRIDTGPLSADQVLELVLRECRLRGLAPRPAGA